MTTPMQPGAPGGTQSLSNAQFGQVNMPTLPKAQGMPMQPMQPLAGGAPLSSMVGTFGSAQQAATWRKPNSILPLSRATIGSVFTPFGQQTAMT